MFVVKEIYIDENTEIVERRTFYVEPMNRENCVRKTVDFLNREYNTKNLKEEEFYIVGLSPEYQMLYVLPMKGEKHKVNVSIFQFFCFVWKTNSKYIICAHNHPNGVCEPSDEDVETMLQFEDICKQFDCIQYEDLVITDSGYYEVIEDEERTYN